MNTLPEKTVRVPFKSAWLSKINWTQAVAVIASLLVIAGIDLPAETQAHIVVGIQALQAVITSIIKTWFTPTITPQSAPPAALSLS